MGSDMMVALGPACVHGGTIFGLNHHGGANISVHLRRLERGHHAGDEAIPAQFLKLPQVRQTHAVLGLQPAGCWGFLHGLNEQQVTIGVTSWQSRLAPEAAGLTGSELVRLALERGHSSVQAIEVLTDLISRHGQCASSGATDHVFLIADPSEAYVLEAAGRYWALQECRQTRAVTDVALTRQDWRRLAPGLASFAIAQGWWQDDGSKLDFAGCLDSRTPQHNLARRRWGRASVALAQQAGAIDLHYFRRLLDEHHENNRALRPDDESERRSSFVAGLSKSHIPLGWFSFGAPQHALYFPLFPMAELPPAFGPASHPESPTISQCAGQLTVLARSGKVDPAVLDATLDRLQMQFDQEAEEFLHRAQRGTGEATLRGEAGALMQRHADAFEKELRRLHNLPESAEVAEWAEEALESPF